MANWVSASTTDYWQDASGGVNYLGGGSWECATGPAATSFNESGSSPFLPDPYYYTSTTHYGVRLTLSWTPTLTTNVAVRIFTNESGYGYYEQILSFPAGVATNRSYLVEWTPVAAERITEIRVVGSGGEFGSYYGSTPLISGIEVDTEGGGEPETRSHLYKHTGFKETVETVDTPNSPGGSYGTNGTTATGKSPRVSVLSKGMWADPVRFGAPFMARSTPVPTPTPGGGSSHVNNDGSNRTFVPSTDENGQSGGRIYETDSGGNPTQPVGEFIPSSSVGIGT